MNEIYDLVLKAIEEEMDKCRDYPKYIATTIKSSGQDWIKDYDKWKTRTPEDEITYKPVEPRRDLSDYDDDEDDDYYYDDFDDYWDEHEDDYYDEDDYDTGTVTSETMERDREEARERARTDFEEQEAEREARTLYVQTRDGTGIAFTRAGEGFKGAAQQVNRIIMQIANGTTIDVNVDDINNIIVKSNTAKANKKNLVKIFKEIYDVSKPGADIWNKQDVFLKSCDDMKDFCVAKDLNVLKKDAKALTKHLEVIANNLETLFDKYDL